MLLCFSKIWVEKSGSKKGKQAGEGRGSSTSSVIYIVYSHRLSWNASVLESDPDLKVRCGKVWQITGRCQHAMPQI